MGGFLAAHQRTGKKTLRGRFANRAAVPPMECPQHAVAAVKDLLGSIGAPEVSSAGDEVGVPLE
jgi:hypothetical protein